VGAILAWRIRRLWLFGIGVGAAVVVLYGSSYLLFSGGRWVPLVPPALALVVTAGVVVLVDRGYAKAIYQGVKKVILNIEIDEEKKQQQVAAITESESFAELEKKAQELREKRRRDRRSGNAAESKTETNEATQAPQEAEPTQEEDYFEQLQKRGKKLRNTDSETTQTPQNSEPTEEAQDEDYFEQLQKRGKKLRNTGDESNS
jgi:hypothetical protein